MNALQVSSGCLSIYEALEMAAKFVVVSVKQRPAILSFSISAVLYPGITAVCRLLASRFRCKTAMSALDTSPL